MDTTHGILKTTPKGQKLLDTTSADTPPSKRNIPSSSASYVPKHPIHYRDTSSDDSSEDSSSENNVYPQQIRFINKSTDDSSNNTGCMPDVFTKDNFIFIGKILLTIPLFVVGTAFGIVYGAFLGLFTGLFSMPCRSIDSETLSPAQKACMTPTLCLCCPIILTVTWVADGLFSGGYIFCSKLWTGRPLWVDIERMKVSENRPCIPPILNTLGEGCVGNIDISVIKRR